MRSSEWMPGAACRGTDPEQFSLPSPDAPLSAAAQDACTACPVAYECLTYSLYGRNGQVEKGVWGGMNEGDRLAEKRRRQRQERRDAA